MSERVYDTAVYVSEWDAENHEFGESRLYRDAVINQLEHNVRDGQRYMLKVPRDEDPETGDILDVDGDRSMDRTICVSTTIYNQSGSFEVTGFVETGSLDDGVSSPRPTGLWKRVQWHQVPFGWVARRDAEKAENVAKVKNLDERDKRAIVALRKAAIEGRQKKRTGGYDAERNGWLVVEKGVSREVFGVKFNKTEFNRLARAGLAMLGSNRDVWSREKRTFVETTSASLLSEAEDMADALIAAEVSA